MDVKNEVLAAEARIRNYTRKTPLDYSLRLSQLTGCQVYLKCENLQYTSAFKTRGAFNKLLSLTTEQRAQGIATASSGNHGAAVAYGLYTLNTRGIVFVPKNASAAKVEAIRSFQIPVEFHGTDTVDTESYAIEYAKHHQMIYISPYNDVQVIGGQGTIAYELMEQLSMIDIVLVPVGGGGLISGIAGYLKSQSPDIKVIGCLPENSPVMAECIKAGRIIEMETKPTLSDATAGGIEPGSITFDLCRQYVDDYVLVSEAEIKSAIVTILKTHYLLIEGAAGVAVAALIKNADIYRDKNIVVLLSGAKITVETLASVLR